MIRNCFGENSSCIILSGGVSGRMGRNKSGLRYSSSHTFLEQLIHTYNQAGIKDICVVINSQAECSIPDRYSETTFVVKNHFPEKGRLYSIQCALMHMEHSSFSFIQNVDSPFISADNIKKLYMMRYQAEWISPVYKGKKGHPVLASASVLNYIRSLHSPNLTLKDVLMNFDCCTVETDHTCLVNINTPQDYEYYFGHRENNIRQSLSEKL